MRNPSKSNGHGTRKRKGKVSRRALLSGLGSGLALTALGVPAKGKREEGNPFSVINTKSPSAGTLELDLLKEINVDSKTMLVRYGNDKSEIRLSIEGSKVSVKIDFEKRKVTYQCVQFEPTPTPKP